MIFESRLSTIINFNLKAMQLVNIGKRSEIQH